MWSTFVRACVLMPDPTWVGGRKTEEVQVCVCVCVYSPTCVRTSRLDRRPEGEGEGRVGAWETVADQSKMAIIVKVVLRWFERIEQRTTRNYDVFCPGKSSI